jgi:hypothetical protein
VKTSAVKFKTILFLLLSTFVVLTTASGYLYNQNKNYQYENQRLIIVNDSILSENLELKNWVRQNKSSTVLKVPSENFKTKASK